MSYIWYKSSNLESFINLNEKYINTYVTRLIKEWQISMELMLPPFLFLADKAFSFNNISLLLHNGHLFFNSLQDTVTYEGFCNVLESIFNTREIEITYTEEGDLDIKVNNQNDKLVSQYIDNTNTVYIHSNKEYYQGFEAGEWGSVQEFLIRFLQKLAPAGRTINSLALVK